ncbi:MAG: hypothetical protein JKY66_06700 [Spongiibacteraceae bacterium]|nr:hypothetical protein [Spongiibacteraceae bacterium]
MKRFFCIVLLFTSSLSSYLLAEPRQMFEKKSQTSQFICPPCYHNRDTQKVHEHDGQCPICGMNLIEKHSLDTLNTIQITAGSGNFLLEGGASHPEKWISVFYHKPKNFNEQSPVLMVIPGAGRNAWDYRDSWIAASERYHVLILSLAYTKENYDLAAYHMGGVIKNIQLNNVEGAKSGKPLSVYRMKDEDIVFDINRDTAAWIFHDFDRLFERVKHALGTNQQRYDLFGHSAGGQILHRLVLFKPLSKANRILASNAGFYTLADLDSPLLFGLKGTGIDKDGLQDSFSQKLTLFIGEKDNESETRGTMLFTPLADQQGLGRFSRGKYFFNTGKEQAKALNMPFNWSLEIVNNVGHDYRAMGEAAARYLYGDK